MTTFPFYFFQVVLHNNYTCRFIDARQYYRPENLEKEVSVLAGQREVLLTEKSERDTDTEAMISQLEQIKLGKGTCIFIFIAQNFCKTLSSLKSTNDSI